MTKHILLKNKIFSMKDGVSPKPPKYSPEDRYGKYRRQAKRKEIEEKGWL